MMPDWPSLKERGGPWPEGVVFWEGGYHIGLPGGNPARSSYRPLGGHELHLQYSRSDQVGLALCRDAAVAYLRSLNSFLSINVSIEGQTYSLIGNNVWPEVRYTSEPGTDYDTALFEACVVRIGEGSPHAAPAARP